MKGREFGAALYTIGNVAAADNDCKAGQIKKTTTSEDYTPILHLMAMD